MRAPWLLIACLAAFAAAGCDSTEGPVDGGADADLGPSCQEDEECADDHECTTDTCYEGRCRHTTDDAPCDDGELCNGTEVCDALRGCVDGDPVTCDDRINCTRDECVPETGRCRSVPDDELCEAGFVCDVSVEGCVPE